MSGIPRYPSGTETALPAPNGSGWNSSPVTVSLTATDDESGGSGVHSITYTASGAQSIDATTVSGASATIDLTADGTTTLTYSATDNAGNVEAPQTVTPRIDTTAPTITGSRTPATGNTVNGQGYGWNNGPLTVGFTCSDDLSGVESCPSSARRSRLQNATTTATVTASAALSGLAGLVEVVEGNPPVALDPWTGSVAVPLDMSKRGSHELTVTATDEAGNTTTKTLNYTVGGVVGPLVPLAGQGHAPSTFKAGSTIPVKFQLTDGTNLVTTATGTVTIGWATVPFAWDPAEQQYQADVHTAKSAPGTYPVAVEVGGVGSVTLTTVDRR